MRTAIVLSTLFVFANCFIANAQPTSGLVAYWPLNGNFTDAGPNAVNGTNYGATATTNAGNTANSAMQFLNPSSSVVQYGTHPVNANLNFASNQDFSVTFSFYLASPFAHTVGFYDNNLNSGGYGIWLWNNGGYRINLNCRNGNINYGPIALDTWTKVCALRSSGVIKLYINGSMVATGTDGTVSPNYGYPARFGTMFFSGSTPPEYNGLNGKLDELRIYNRALTDAEISQIAALPVKLTSFTARKIAEANHLEWTTASEFNNSHFNLQRSENGNSFTTIANIPAVGNSTTTTTYNYVDRTSNGTSVVYYRLHQVDKDGKSEYSPVITITTTSSKEKLFLLQNPASGTLRLRMTAERQTLGSIRISDVLGRTVSLKKVPLSAGENFTALDISTISPGLFFVTAEVDGEKKTLRFTRQ